MSIYKGKTEKKRSTRDQSLQITRIRNPELGFANPNNCYSTTFDGIEGEDEFTVLKIVLVEQRLIVILHQAVFEKPATDHAVKTTGGIVWSDPVAATKEGEVAYRGFH